MKSRLFMLACVVGVSCGWAMGLDAHAAESKPNPKLIEQGKATFDENCVPCHQEGAVGLPGTAPSLSNRDLLAIASDRYFTQTIHDGRPDTAMPSFADILTPIQVKGIIAYLRSFAKFPYRGDAVDKEKSTKGDVLLGQERFQQICSSCHGSKGEGYEAGGSGTAIGKIGFLSKASDGFIRATIREGRSGTPMHSFWGASGLANLSPPEIDGIIAYLRSVQGK
jgi:cbb3-type cytochrome c oxidase subunit III